MTEEWVKKVLGRAERLIPETAPPKRVLITGGAGSVGQALYYKLRDTTEVWLTDLGDGPTGMDVLDRHLVESKFAVHRPEVVYHLAGAKHAPHGELDPWGVLRTNVEGTRNVLAAAAMVGARVVVASTCKACDPETAYGASKLLAERMTLNARQWVVRFHNIIETSGNVFTLWKGADPISVTECERYFISLEEAVNLTVWAGSEKTFKPGRYAIAPGDPRRMVDVARELYPDTKQEMIPRRRGDRFKEPALAACEVAQGMYFEGSIWRIESPHDHREAV